MTDSLVNLLVPYSRFLEYQDLRHRIAAGLSQRDPSRMIDADVAPAPAETASARPLTASSTERQSGPGHPLRRAHRTRQFEMS
jgi:hypothetical protein